MRRIATILLVFVVLLSGCSTFLGTDTETPTKDNPVTPDPPDTPIETGNDTDDHNEDWATTFGPESPDDYADPPDDTLGWENGYWYDESLDIDASDGLNAAELDKVTARSTARVEHLRGIEFNESVPVDVITREEYTTEYGHGSDTDSPAFVDFDNAKFEAMFLVGEDRDSLTVQDNMRGDSVGGFYSSDSDEIVVVSNSDSAELSEETLVHELVHAAQDQKYNLSNYNADTRDAYNARNGLIEGDAEHTSARFTENCNESWECITEDSGPNQPGPDFHWGIYLLEFFPYSDGYTFIDHLGQTGGWDAVNAAYESVPQSSEVIIHPDKYGVESPAELTVEDTSTDDWNRVSVADRPDYATLGESGIFTMFANTLFDESRESTVLGQSLYGDDHHSGGNNDPYNYDAPFSNGWANDKLYVYKHSNSGDGAYVWTTKWDSSDDAKEFADRYKILLDYYRAEETDTQGVYTIESSTYADAFRVVQNGDTVTIVNAPSLDDLNDIHTITDENRQTS